MVHSYTLILVFMVLCFLLAVALLLSAFLLAPRRADVHKQSTYECGFEPFGHSKGVFHVKYYLVAILFIIFDLEIALLVPWAVSVKMLGWSGFIMAFIVLVLLTIGFIYEWKKGALDW